MGKPKKVNFELITNKSSEPYSILAEIREEYHEELEDAKIALAVAQGAESRC